MTLTFKNFTEARAYLADNGYTFERQGGQYGNPNRKAEVYAAGPLVAVATKVPFQGIRVTIR